MTRSPTGFDFGIDHRRAFQRYYDPATARYTTPDPLGLASTPNDHAYVVNPMVWDGSRVIAEHVSDPNAPSPHFHAGEPPSGSPRDINMKGKTYKGINPKHHLYYPGERTCGG